MNYNYSKDAEILILSLNNFDRIDFEKWYKENNIYITIQDYMQYIILKNNEKFDEEIGKQIKDIEINIDIKFKDNLINVIKNTNINIDELKRFYMFAISNIGSGAIIHYLNNK